jgi:hypothetical protein
MAYSRTADIVAHLPGVKAAVGNVADGIEVRARANLAAHYHRGHSRIDRTRQDTDVLVSLVDRAALSIEFGHTARNGRPVEGLYVITRAAG